MALQKHTIRVGIAGGVETKADPKTVPSVRLLDLQNGVFTRGTTIAKRLGYDALSQAVLGSATAYDGARGLGARDSELVLFDDDTCYSYLDDADQWDDAGPVMSVAQSDRVLVKTNSQQRVGDYAATAGIGVVCWDDSRDGVWYAVVEDDGGRVTYGPAQASSSGERPRVVVVDTKIALIWIESASDQLKIVMVDPSAPHAIDASFPAVLTADLVADYSGSGTPGPPLPKPGFDVVSVGGIAPAYIAWCASAGIRTAVIDPSGVLGSPVTGWSSPVTEPAPAAVVSGPVITATPGVLTESNDAIAWVVATAGQVYAASYIMNAPDAIEGGTALDQVDLGAGVYALACTLVDVAEGGGETHCLDVYADTRPEVARNSFVSYVRFNLQTSAPGSPRIIRGAALASSAWTRGERSFVNVVHDVPLFGVFMTIRDDGFCVARTLPGLAGGSTFVAHLPRVTEDDGAVRWTAVYKTALEGINDDVFTEEGLRLVTLDFESDASHQTAYAGRCLYLGGATPMLYDGQAWIEHGPHYGLDWEDDEELHTVDAEGGLVETGSHAWVFWVEATLATGEIVRGPVSKPYTVELEEADVVTFAIPTLRITEAASVMGGRSLDRADARICVARTIAGDASVYYRCSSLNPSASGPNGYVENDTTIDSVEFVDNMPDATLITQDPLYINGGILSNDPVPGTGVLAAGKGRLFATDPSDDSLVRHTKERSDGYAMEWAPELAIAVDPHGGAITGIAVMDDAVILFKRSAIYMVAGPGPLDNPEDPRGGWSAPQLITSDVGSLSQRSIAVTPAGLVFQSAKGIYLLDRSRGVSYVGSSVEAYNAQTITRATLVDDTTQVRFLTSSGVTLLWDYLHNQWSTWTNHLGLDAVVTGGTYYYLRTDGRVFRQSADYDDGGNRIPLVIETAWLHLQEQLQGFQRIYHLHVIGNRKSAHTLRVQYQTDYDVGWSEPFTFDATSEGGSVYGEGAYGAGVYGGSSPTRYQFRVHVGRKCEAIRFRFSDYEAAGTTGAAFELTELLITGGVKGPAFKLPAARSA